MNATTATEERREKFRAHALAEIDNLDTAMRERGLVTPAFERFINDVRLLVSVHVDPSKAVNLVLSVISGERVTVRS